MEVPQHKPELLDYLKTEYEVFKAMLSAHPFDGLYSYFKRQYNFLSNVKATESFGEFNVMGMIKSINRGMR
ncbi:MAG: hypothetical protein H6765_01415 [Candidatus Peribacteria bacterium]|nr:MAG: hypothetical protein H6765_01415 [Candidatus Peribacteria bacterium]